MIMIFSDGAEEKQEKVFEKYNSQTNKVSCVGYNAFSFLNLLFYDIYTIC